MTDIIILDDEISEDKIDFVLKIDNAIYLERYKYFDLLYDMIIEYLSENMLSICEYSFYDTMMTNLNCMFFVMIENIYNIDEECYRYLYSTDYIISKALKLVYSKFIPIRSYDSTFIRRIPNKVDISKKLQAISESLQPDQRSDEWYKFRHSLITASSAWKVFDSPAVLNNLIFEKCSPCKIHDTGNGYVNTESPLHWGHKYEPLSIMLYESNYDTQVGEYGCIMHNEYGFLGASPDGINIKKDNDRFGRMLEIKNVVNREITKIPKKEYWIQMQIQMDVCNLNECDFLETRFEEYDSKEEYCKDGDSRMSLDGKLKGIILLFYDENKPLYEYYVEHIHGKYDSWEKDQFKMHGNHLFMRSIYWKLDEFSCILVLRNKKWFKQAIIEIEKVSNIIKYESKNGFEHRAPKKRERKTSFDSTESKCHINLSSKGIKDIQINTQED